MSNNIYGEEYITLTESNLPSHYHYIVYNSGGTPSTDWDLTYLNSYGAKDGTQASTTYYLDGSNNEPDLYQTSIVGQQEEFSTMQPTVFIANMFIYAKN